MKKSGLAIILLCVPLITGCGNSQFLESKIGENYKNSDRLDSQFLESIKSSGKTNKVFSDEEYIRYGKSICTLLDKSQNPEDFVDEYWGEDQVVSDAAIQVYCPKYAKNI